jgi:hypothetical protein
MNSPHSPDPVLIPKPCPWCGAGPGTLTLRPVLVSRPLASFSLAGAGMKTSARTAVAVACSACDKDVVGHLTDPNHWAPDDPADAPPGD